jgi:hypothetical protein
MLVLLSHRASGISSPYFVGPAGRADKYNAPPVDQVFNRIYIEHWINTTRGGICTMAANRRTDGVVVGNTRGNAESRQPAQQAQVREERRRHAEVRAKQLLTEARASGAGMVVRHTLDLLIHALSVDYVTLSIGPDTRPHAVICATRRAGNAVASSDGTNALDPPASFPVDKAVSRVHAFLYDAGHPDLHGRLSVHSMQPRSFGAAEVALLHALAALLAREVEWDPPTPRRHDSAPRASDERVR